MSCTFGEVASLGARFDSERARSFPAFDVQGNTWARLRLFRNVSEVRDA